MVVADVGESPDTMCAMRSRVGFIGLGTMGAPMAAHLISARHEVVVWNRTRAKCDRFDGFAEVAESIEALAEVCETILLCLGGSEDVLEVVDRIAGSAAAGTLVVDHSTIAPSAAKECAARLARTGVRFLDAPITGGSIGAKEGTLTIMVGGEEEDYLRAQPIFDAYSRMVGHVGPVGSGQATKMANQIAVAGSLLGMCEALAFAEKAGLDLETTRQLLVSGAAGSWALENYGPKVIAGDHSPGFAVRHQRKDFAYVMESAGECGAAVPATEVTDRLLAALEAEGRSEEATTALIEVYRRGTGG